MGIAWHFKTFVCFAQRKGHVHMFRQHQGRISAGNKAHTAPGSEPGELREGCCLQRQTQHPQKRRRISTYWGLEKIQTTGCMQAREMLEGIFYGERQSSHLKIN